MDIFKKIFFSLIILGRQNIFKNIHKDFFVQNIYKDTFNVELTFMTNCLCESYRYIMYI